VKNFSHVWDILHEIPVYRQLSDGQVGYLSGLLDATYGAPWRAYHNYDHIVDMLQNAVSRGNIQHDDLPGFLTAIVFHDAVYDVTAKFGYNESNSADFARKAYVRLFGHTRDVQFIQDLIIATVHDGELRRPLEEWMADLDLASLSADYEVFHENSENIVREYCTAFSEKDVRMGRIAFFEKFLARPFIYYFRPPQPFQPFSEMRARENMKRELDWLIRTIP
jgi:predicted metal-dependent HD superfamily phosphohydrolase